MGDSFDEGYYMTEQVFASDSLLNTNL